MFDKICYVKQYPRSFLPAFASTPLRNLICFMADYPPEKTLAVRGRPVDAGALRQIERCLADDEARAGALCATTI